LKKVTNIIVKIKFVELIKIMIFPIFISGYGVFATRDISKGEFLAEYVGEKIAIDEGEKRIRKNESGKSYVYFVTHKKEKFW